MKTSLLELLICPNTRRPGFEVYPTRVVREGRILPHGGAELRPADEIDAGWLISTDGRFAYPIAHGVLSMLSDEDVDLREFESHFAATPGGWPARVATAVEGTRARLCRRTGTDDGTWNRAEMNYYDNKVDTPEKRAAMARNIAETYLPHIFLPRDKIILGPIRPGIAGQTLVEIGCGNARTIARLMPPAGHGYRYVGLDIAFWRAVVAKQACPEGEFIQASAFNLPLKSACADVGISFGMLHHLPRPIEGLVELNRTMKQQAALGIHEPIVTRKIVTGRFKSLESAMETYQHSDHDGEVDLDEMMAELRSLGYTVKRRMFLASPFRTAAEAAIRRVAPGALKSPGFIGLSMRTDQVLIHTICRLSAFLKPRGVIMLLERR